MTSFLVSNGISIALACTAAGADQINTSVQHLNKITQQNAAVSIQVATGADGLNLHASELRSLLAFYRFGGVAYLSKGEEDSAPAVPAEVKGEQKSAPVERSEER